MKSLSSGASSLRFQRVRERKTDNYSHRVDQTVWFLSRGVYIWVGDTGYSRTCHRYVCFGGIGSCSHSLIITPSVNKVFAWHFLRLQEYMAHFVRVFESNLAITRARAIFLVSLDAYNVDRRFRDWCWREGARGAQGLTPGAQAMRRACPYWNHTKWWVLGCAPPARTITKWSTGQSEALEGGQRVVNSPALLLGSDFLQSSPNHNGGACWVSCVACYTNTLLFYNFEMLFT